MLLKSPVASEKVHKVRHVDFVRMVRLPGYPGASNLVTTEGEANLGTSRAVVKSLVIVGNKLIVDGDYFILLEGNVQGWKY
jgi:hypothetical protein